ncbi:MAG TPA: signal peptidase I [Firmicutes bacterium]|nr:signal peptidase I [Bacillota bacterium]
MKKFFRILKNILVILIVLIAISMMMFTILSTTSSSLKNRSLFGYKAFIVLTDSMSATDFKAGDLVIVKSTSPKKLKTGDIISYRSRDLEHYDEVVTHKIRKITTEPGGGPAFITYGTTTGIDDKEIVSHENVLGKYCFTLPKMGSLFQYLKTTPGYIMCILIPFLLLILIQALNAIRLFSKYKRETLEEMNEEKKKLEQERIETAIIKEKLEAAEETSIKMREELEELKKVVHKTSAKRKTAVKSAVAKPKVKTATTKKNSKNEKTAVKPTKKSTDNTTKKKTERKKK